MSDNIFRPEWYQTDLIREDIKKLHIDNINTMKDIVIIKKHLNDIKKTLKNIKDFQIRWRDN